MLKLTPYQSIFFYEWIIDPLNTNYNIVVDNTVVGDFDLVKNEKSILNMLNNILVFKSNIADGNSTPQWKVRPLSESSVRYFSEEISDEEIYSLISEPFDLANDNLMRQYIIKEKEHQYRIIFVLSHIIIDGISTPEFYKTWADHYNNGFNEKQLSIEEQIEKHNNLTDTFEVLLEKNKVEMHSFWEKHMKDVVGIDFSFLKKQVASTEDKSTLRFVSEHMFSYNSDVLTKVKSLRHNYRITPYIFGQIVLACLLHKITRQKVLGISYPVAILEGKELLYGAHVNTLVIDYRFNETTTVKNLIEDVLLFFNDLKKTKSKYLPVNEIVKYADNVKILDIAFSQTFQRDYFEKMNGLELAKINHQFQIDLVGTLLIEQEEYDNNLNFRIRYDKDILDETLVHNFSNLYRKLFLDILDDLTNQNDHITIDSYRLLDDQQYNKIVYKWNSTESIAAIDSNLKDLFEKQAYLTPDNLALVYGEVSLTYHELNSRANQLAHYLLSKYEISPNDLIAICQSRSEYLPISILGVLKTGAAYVPMDPGSPRERLIFMLEDTNACVLLTDHINHNELKLLISNLPTNAEDVSQTAIKEFSEENTQVGIGAEDLAYIIYTSGTTGLPKGVMIEHKSVVDLSNGVQYINNKHKILIGRDLEYKKCLWYSNIVFDAHVYDIYPALLNGDCVHMVDDEKRHDFQKLSSYTKENKIDIGLIPPVLLDKKNPITINALMVGGESTSLDVMKAHLLQGMSVVNLYGPTEITAISSSHLFKLGDSNTNIGRPLPNTTYYVLDENLQVLPVGAVGELHIGGVGVSRGYLNNPDLTAEKFIANPFQTIEEKQRHYNGRIYKTGDLVRYLSNGEVEYIGRKDFQIKIRGFRVELGEIERVLSGYRDINQVIVLAKTNTNGMKYLAAYYSAGTVYESFDLIEYLGEHLPDYMIPSVFTQIDSFSMTSNGKLDLKALPEPVFGDSNVYIAPNSELESELCEIYADILGLPLAGVGVEDNFFQLGGDSITAIQLVNKIRQNFDIGVINVKDIFKSNTVRLLSVRIAESRWEEKEKIGIDEQGNLEGKVNLLPIQKWFFDAVNKNILPDYNHWNHSFMLYIPELDTDVLQESVEHLADYHDAFRLLFRKNINGGYEQFYQKKLSDVKVDSLNINDLPDLDHLNAILTGWQNNFDIFSGPLFHIGYIDGYSDGSARIHVAAHHLIIDAVSWRIIQDDLQRIYTALLNKKQNEVNHSANTTEISNILKRKGTSYRQWVDIIHNYKNNNQDEQDYWKDIIREIPIYNSSLSSLKSEECHYIKSELDDSYTKKILRESNIKYNTQANDLLIATLASTLQDLIGGECQYITLEGHGREQLDDSIDLNGTMGWFTSLYPVKITIPADHSIGSLISDVKDTLRHIPNQGIGYGAIHGYTSIELPAVAFNYLGQYDTSNSANWSFVNEDTGTSVSSENKEHNMLTINCGIMNGKLIFSVAGQLPEQVLFQFTEDYKAKLIKIINNLNDQSSRNYLTLSDINYIISKKYLENIQKNAEVEGIYLANSLQQGFIYHGLNQGKSDESYRTQLFWNYHHSIDVEKLRMAWTLAQQKFSVLRLRFAWEEELVQIIDKDGALDWRYTDISNESEEEQQLIFDALCEKDRKEPYDFTKSGLFRVYLVKRSNNVYNCIFNNHHSIMDGWSNPILLQTIHEFYVKLLNNEAIHLKRDEIYSSTQMYLQDTNLEHLEYFNDSLNRIEEHEDLSGLLTVEKRNVNIADYKHIRNKAEQKITVSGSRYTDLKKLCSSNNITVNAFLQYCWHRQISIYSANKTTVLGMVVSGRDIPVENIENAVGLYINTLPVIVEHTDDSLINILKTLQNDINEISSKSNTNLAKLQKGGNRLFNSLFAFENYPIPKNTNGEIEISFIGANENLDYPLVVAVFDIDHELIFRLSYAGELFDASIINEMLNGVATTIDQFISDPSIKTPDMEYISDEVRQKEIVYDWNSADEIIPAASTLKEMFEAQVLRTPDNEAFACSGLSLTYQELNSQANQLAHYLLSKYHITADDLIAVCQTRSEYLIISILAILKTGAAYVPMDTDAPKERLRFMLDDTKSQILLTDHASYEDLKQLTSDLSITVEDVNNTVITGFTKENTAVKVRPGDLAYIIYTSGTTGLPKGVMIEHKGVIELSNAMEFLNNKYKIAGGRNSGYKKCLWYSNIIFDAHVYDIFPALLHGDSVYMVENSTRHDFNKLNAFISEHKIDFGLIPPALLDRMNPMMLNALMVGGEATGWDVIEAHLLQGIPVVNLYGPTEITVASSYHLFKPGDSNTNIGRPLPNTTYYVLDENLHVLPVGAAGELHIGGAGVSRGYLNNSELTAEKFITNPFQTVAEAETNSNARLYKTGDLVRYLPNGEVEYIGRKDFQIKIRGFRVELGEIERILSGYKEIGKVLVLDRTHGNGMKFLVGYYSAPEVYEASELNKYLSTYLPDYMIPTVFIHVDRFPMTSSGKLDIKTLPQPVPGDSDVYVAPSSELEMQLCDIYADILGLPAKTISVEDNFFRLGGDSITAIKLHVRVSKAVSKNIDLPIILKFSNIKALSAFIENSSGEILEKIVPVEVKEEEQLLSFSQERLWFIETYEGGSNIYNIPLVFKLHEKVCKESLSSSIEKIIRRHEVLRSVIKTNNNGIGYQKVIGVEEITISTEIAEGDHHLSALIHNATHKTFHLSTEPPVHIQYYQLNDSTYISIVIHHIAFDGWSVDILMKELVHYYHYYESRKEGQFLISELPDPDIQYKDYALWQRNYLSGERLEKQMSYWEKELCDYETLNLPADKLRPKKVDYTGANVLFNIPVDLSNDLRQLSKNENVSLYSVLLSAYYLLLSGYSNQTDILIGTPVAGRSQHETNQLIGFFVNTLVLRGRIKSEESILNFIKRTGELVAAAQEHQDLPFEKLVQHLNLKQDQSRNPVFQILFTVQSFGKEKSKDLNDLLKIYAEEEFRPTIAQFDMAMMIDDSEESMKGMINYATALFEPQTMQNYIDTYLEILEQLVLKTKDRNALQEIKDIKYISKEKLDENISSYQGNSKAVPNKTLQTVFEEQVEKNPDGIAFVYKDISLTFKEINIKANKLAHFLISSLSVKPDDLVAICQDRSENMLISILGILKSGAAYVPIDPDIPGSRLQYIINDTNAKAILVNTAHKKKIKEILNEVSVPLIDLQITDADTYPETNPETETKPDNLAYVIYTSGTTGQPKGVMIEHKGVLNLVCSQEDIIEEVNTNGHPHKKNMLWYYNYIFDGHVYELYNSLLKGYTIYMVDEKMRVDYYLLSKYIEENNICTAVIPPVLLQTDHILKVRTLVVAGEVSNQEIINKYLEKGVQVINSYGPTECTVCSSQHLFNIGDSILNIGKPIANVTNYILNGHLQFLPVGAIGELYIGGAGVARGYLNNEELTSEKFIPNPHQTNHEKIKGHNGILYKTGDLVRYLENGDIEYIGRKDFQVKIRGYRIELGEIENVVSGYGDINQAVVVSNAHTNGMAYLLGYYVSNTDYSSSELKSYVGKHLPNYMIPYDFMKLNEIPMTVNGKLDKKRLPSPTFGEEEEKYASPENGVQRKLVEIYSEVLGRNPGTISITDDFFQIGGSSIIAIRLIMKINNHFKTNISVMDLFNAPSINSLSELVEENNNNYKPLVLLNRNPLKKMFMIHPAMADSDVYLNLAGKLKDTYKCYGVNSYNRANDRKIDRLTALSQYYLEQIKTVQNDGPYYLLGWSLGGRFTLEIAGQLEKAGVKDINVFLLDTWMINEGMGKNEEEKERTMIKMMDSFAIPSDDRDAVRNVLLVEDIISSQPISSILEYTNVILFRATADENTASLREIYPENNVESCIRDSNQMKIIDINCQHNDILNFDEDIADIIKSMEYAEL
ncbi:non-ribosomal peptide synthetase [Chryseobacterium luteum]|uniref:Carrier domain-containing protein n=1 Tax=Chryseobacterium luteum TaxID=421531 RepID=A0A085ZH49_9FLAO|nr:non-ribosomal peptide synthetase [Chryseobacterium luteum]KFF03763.1 hypothetical protein IX38_10120 [Chryseobacterium luteum]